PPTATWSRGSATGPARRSTRQAPLLGGTDLARRWGCPGATATRAGALHELAYAGAEPPGAAAPRRHFPPAISAPAPGTPPGRARPGRMRRPASPPPAALGRSPGGGLGSRDALSLGPVEGGPSRSTHESPGVPPARCDSDR